MPSELEPFSSDERRILRELDFVPESPIEDSLRAWRQVGRSWSHSLVAAYQARHTPQQAMFKQQLNNAAINYMKMFVDVAETIVAESSIEEEALALLEHAIADEDAELVKPVNTWFQGERLRQLSPEMRHTIALSFADPHGETILPGIHDEPLDQVDARSLYISQLNTRIGLILPAERGGLKPHRSNMRAVLGAVGVGSALALGFLKRRRA